KPVLSSSLDNLLDEKIPLGTKSNSVKEADTRLPLLYAKLDSDESSDSSVKWVLKEEETEAVLFSFHDDPLAGHFGFYATFQ
ncbi:8631_t:CDS:2, partial [Gigaspora margarita]